MTEDLRWLVAQVHVGADYDANDNLLRRSFCTVFPREHEPARHGRWSVGRIKPRFPGYIFVGFRRDQSADELLHDGPSKVFAIRDFIRDDRKSFIRVSQAHIDELAEKVLEHDAQSWGPLAKDEPLRPGDWVPIPSGPYVGVPCRIDAIDKSGRVEATIGGTRVTFKLSDLSAQPRKNVRGRPKALPSTITHSNFHSKKSRT
jgi:transcription antitermination factor NusG